MWKRWLSLFAALLWFALPAYAEEIDGVLWSAGTASTEAFETEQWQAQLEASGADMLPGLLPEGAKGILEENGLSQVDYEALLSLSPMDFFRSIWALVKERAWRPLAAFGALLGLLLLCAMLEGLQSLGDTTITEVFTIVSVLAAAAAVTPALVSCITETAFAVQECAAFIASFIPVFASVVTVAGQPATAGVYTGLLFLACQVVSQAVAEGLVQLMGIYLAFCIAGSIAPGIQIASVAKTIQQTVCWVLGLLVTVFVALLSIQTLTASGSDQVLGKTAKFLLGSFVPVVGGALGDAFSAAQGYLRLLKTTVGAFGILAALFTFLPVFLQTFLWYLSASAASALGETLGVKQAAGLLKSAASTLGILIAVIFSFALLVIVSISLVLIASTGG